MKTALILIDFENEWILPISEYYIGDLTDLTDKTNQLIQYAREKGYKIIFMRHIEKDAEDAFMEGSTNVDILPTVEILETDTVITKYKISPFYNTNLANELDGYDSIIVSGILINLCVRMTVEEAYDREYEITIVSDCCAAFDKGTHDFTLKDLSTTRPEVTITTLNELIK